MAGLQRSTRELAATSTFEPGKRDELVLDLEPGRYATVCTVANHRELGMIGTLTVK